MPLTLVLGPANSAKAGEVLGGFAQAARRGALLVVPTAADADHYGRELAVEGAVLGSVLTFSGLAGEIASRVGYGGIRLSALQRQRVVRRVVRDLSLTTLQATAGTRGFATAAASLISELERSLIEPRRFAGAMRTWGRGDSRRERYATDLATLYRAYVQELDRIGRVDADLYTWRAVDALRAAPASWGLDPVFFYGFDDLHALERDVVETLARIVGVQVTVSLSYEPGRAAFAARAEAVEELRPLAERVLELPALDDYYEPSSRRALHHLERHLFERGEERVEPGGAIRLLEAGGERAEAELVAAEIHELLQSGTSAEEIVVICRSVGRMAPLLERVFAQYGIATTVQRGVPFAHTALGRGVIALARCAWLQDASAEELLAYLRTPGVLRRPEVADRLELAVQRRALRRAVDAVVLLDWELAELGRLREADEPWSELSWQARRLFSRPHRGEARQLSGDEELDGRALATLLGALAELEELGERPSETELIELLEELEVPAGDPPREGAVLIAEPLAIRARRFRAVFVCGLQEGQFPLPGSLEPFLSDERRRELALATGLRLPFSEDSLSRERYLFYACVSRATEQLVLSYRSSDEEGNIELRSPLIADVEDLLVEGWARDRRQRLLADVVWAAAEAPTARERARAEAAQREGGFADQPERRLSATALALARHREVISAGALESYAQCPVKWLVERELAPARMEPDPEPIVRGSYMHDVLEELLRRLGGPVRVDSLARALEILEELLRELPAPVGVGLPEPLRVALLAGIEADLRRYLAHEAIDGSDWSPAEVELRFGFKEDDGGLPAVELGEGVRLRGMVDRVDVDPDGARAIVRDYKTGGVRPQYQGNRWQEDRQLQVALYMLAVRRLLGLEPVAGFYQPLGGDDLRPRGVYLKGAPVGTKVLANDGRSQEELDEALANAEQRALELTARLRSGEVVPCPQTCSRNGCSYPGICRSQ